MELSWEEWKAMRKRLRRYLGATGWILLLYYLIMNVSVIAWTFVEMIFSVAGNVMLGNPDALEEAAMQAAGSGWGYFLAAAIGLLILLLWKKPRYFREVIWAEEKPMQFGTFLGITCVFLGGQLISQICFVATELVLNGFGYTIAEGVEALSVDTDNISMFLYAALLAPISEEILFRGLILKRLMPYGKRFAIFCTAIAFGLLHSNPIQTPFAFAVSLVLGYVAAEYSVGWAIMLHVINNLVLSDVINVLTAGLPEQIAGILVWIILVGFAVTALIILIRKREKIREWMQQEQMNGTCLRCFFSSGGMIVFMAVMAVMMVVNMFMLVSPL